MELWDQPGKRLRTAREAAGFGVSDVVHQMKFPRTVIEALERDDYTIFSSPTYARSYLSQYAEFLGVDPSKWLDFFEPAAFAGPQDVLSMIESPSPPEPRPAQSNSRGGSSSNLLSTVLLILLTSGLIYGAITGYAYLETRLGGPIANQETPVPSSPVAPVTPPVPTTAVLPAAQVEANTPTTANAPTVIQAPVAPADSSPPPRATIVHE